MSRLALLVACCAALTACGGAPTAKDPVKLRRGNLLVVETHVPRQITFAEFARNEPKMLRLASHARDIEVRAVLLPAGRALRVEYVAGGAHVRRYYFRSGELMYVLMTTGGGSKQFERSARRFRFPS
jgi:hypothetical protein